ncbi:MAG: ABC transporter permease subunit [Acidobacteriota bacterium]|nr:ABC transporter permease subunit [Acidobacteriota bacterium]
MLKTIVKKELLENIFSYRFPLFALICLVLIPLGMSVNNAQYAKRVRDYQEQIRLADDASANLSMSDLMGGTVAIKGFRPPALLSVFAQGFENALPLYYEFTQDGATQGESASGDESLVSIQGKFDFVFLVQMVISLIGLLFASDVISGEKEAGTLRAMLSNRLPRDAILVGKITGGYLALAVPFLAAFLLSTLVLLLGGFPLFGGDAPARIAVLALAAALFMLIYYTIGTMVSTVSFKARTSLVAILLIWSAFQLVIPKLGDMLASLIDPIRTETQVSLETSLLAKTIDTETAKELGKQYDLIFGSARKGAADDTASPERKRWDPLKADIEQRARERKAREIRAITETYRQERRRQQSLASNLALISPSAAFTRLASDLCGTGELARTKYLAAVQSHQLALDQALFQRVRRTVMIHPGGGTSLGFSVQPIDFKALPKFTVASSSLAEALKANVQSLAMLAFWLIAPFVFAYVKFRKYDVR